MAVGADNPLATIVSLKFGGRVAALTGSSAQQSSWTAAAATAYPACEGMRFLSLFLTVRVKT
jgi:hypothetical protein